MNSKIKIAVGIIFFTAILTMIIGACFGNMTLFWICFAILMSVSIALLTVQYKKYDYKCRKCGTVFSVSFKEMILGINSGDIKKLYCPHCKTKEWCNATPKLK